MTLSDPTYCQLERFVFDGDKYDAVTESYDRFPAVWRRILQLWEIQKAAHPSVGVSVILHNRLGRRIQVGVSDRGWLLILDPVDNTHIVRRTKNPGDDQFAAFLLPEWTEFTLECVHSAAYAREALSQWLDVNTVPPA
jgi:hypothetical protein